MRWRKYADLTRVSFRKQSAYRLDALMGLAGSIVFLGLYFFIWKAIASSGELGYPFQELMTYFVVGQFVKNTSFIDVERFLGSKIRRGTIVNEMKRPISVFSQAYFSQLGRIVFRFLARSVPIAALGLYFFNLKIPDPATLAAFLLSVFLSFNLVFLVSFNTSMLIFWTKVEWAVRGSRNHIQGIMSGLYFPLFLVPSYLKPLFDFLPFQAMIDGPIRIFMADAAGKEILLTIGNQLVWLVLLLLLSSYSWRKARRKMTVQGG